MRVPQSILMALVVGLVVCSSTGAWAQGRRGGGGFRPKQSTRPQQGNKAKQSNQGKGRDAAVEGPRPVEEFMRMPPEERERELQRLPPERQEKIRQQLQRYDQMSPQQKERLQRLWQLPPGRQQEVRQSVRDFTEQPQERRQAMRRQLGQVQAMSPEERTAYFNSPEFKNQYSPDEQRIMKNMTEVLPPQ